MVRVWPTNARNLFIRQNTLIWEILTEIFYTLTLQNYFVISVSQKKPLNSAVFNRYILFALSTQNWVISAQSFTAAAVGARIT